MSDLIVYITMATVLGGPVAGGVFVWNLRQRGQSLKKLCLIAGATVLPVVLASFIKLETISVTLNIALCIAAYLAWCFLASACWTLRPLALRVLAGTVAYVTLLPGYFLGTAGILALMFIVGDYLETPIREAELAPGLSCRVMGWGAAFSDEGYTVHLYRFLPWAPLVRVEVASVTDDETDPGSGPAVASCESAAQGVRH